MLITHQTNSKNLSLFILLFGVLFLSVIGIKQSFAGDEEKLIGSWRGTVWVDDKPIGVDMTIDSVTGKQADNKFHYGDPRSCKVNAVYLTERDSKYWFSLKKGTGNICISKLNSGRLVVEFKNANELSYTVTSEDGSFSESEKMKRD